MAAALAANKTRPPAVMLPLFRLPILLYRMGLGRLLGRRFMMLTHVGRCSGRLRHTILAVLSFDSKTGVIKAISAWPQSDWFLNIQAFPALQVECDRVRYRPSHRLLSTEEIAVLLTNYRQQHPVFSSIACRIPGWQVNPTDNEMVRLAGTLRGIEFRPAAQDPDPHLTLRPRRGGTASQGVAEARSSHVPLLTCRPQPHPPGRTADESPSDAPTPGFARRDRRRIACQAAANASKSEAT